MSEQFKLDGYNVRTVANPYDSAKQAFDKWTAGQLWCGKPVRLGKNKIHVYGLYMRNWSKVYIEFTDRYIMVVKPPKSPAE